MQPSNVFYDDDVVYAFEMLIVIAGWLFFGAPMLTIDLSEAFLSSQLFFRTISSPTGDTAAAAVDIFPWSGLHPHRSVLKTETGR